MEEGTPHYAHPTGIALGLTAGIVYTICALFVTVWPAQALGFFKDWFHGIDIGRVFAPPQLSLGAFLRGLVEIVLAFYLVGLVYGWLYNRCVAHCKRMGWI